MTLTNRALDVKSAILTYIAAHIHHEGNRFGLAGIACRILDIHFFLGNMLTSVFSGNQNCDSSQLDLENAIDAFNTAFYHFVGKVNFDTLEQVSGNSIFRTLEHNTDCKRCSRRIELFIDGWPGS